MMFVKSKVILKDLPLILNKKVECTVLQLRGASVFLKRINFYVPLFFGYRSTLKG